MQVGGGSFLNGYYLFIPRVISPGVTFKIFCEIAVSTFKAKLLIAGFSFGFIPLFSVNKCIGAYLLF